MTRLVVDADILGILQRADGLRRSWHSPRRLG